MHAAKIKDIYNPSEWRPYSYNLREEISWSEKEQLIKVSPAGDTEPIISEILLCQGAFWSQDHFRAGDKVLILMKKNPKVAEAPRRGSMIATQAFFRRFLAGETPNDAVMRIMNLPCFSEDAQKVIVSVATSGISSGQREIGFPDFLNERNAKDYYRTVKPYLLPEQRRAVERWLESIRTSKNWEKIRLLLSVSPSAPNRDIQYLSYENIISKLSERIIGLDDLKRNLARMFSEKISQKKRGTVLLFHGLAGTGKTEMALAVAEAIHLGLVRVNLGNISSTISIIGSEGTYQDSDAGVLAHFFYSEKTSETVILFDELDKLAKAGTERGKDGNVIEALLALLDRNSPQLCDNFLDGVPIDCRNTIFILTANRIDNIPPELINRCDLVYHMKPMSVTNLKKIMIRHASQLSMENNLPGDWLTDEAYETILKYRGDFGARDVIGYLKILSIFAIGKESGESISAQNVHKILSEIADIDSPAVRFHRNEGKYTQSQKDAILNTFAVRASCDNLSSQEKRSLDLRLEYLTKLIPEEEQHFDKDSFYDHARKHIFGCERQIDQIAADYYAADLYGCIPTPKLLWGPPGVGKTSIVEAAAAASRRKYVRLQVNGITDPSFFRGTAPEYVAANAGRLITKMAEAESLRVLLHLDEIDKMGREASMTLLDLLDGKFYNTFLETYIDTSNVVVIATCNDLSSVDPVLRSRFDLVEMSGYSAKEKRLIAEKYVIPELIRETPISFTQEAFDQILSRYETDSGIRAMEHGIEKVVKQCMLRANSTRKIMVRPDDVARILGPSEYKYTADKEPGCINALGTYGSSHGMVMPIRVTLLNSGKRRITGLPEESIKDCIAIAETWLEVQYGYELSRGFHIQFNPPGVKKDGPSAGVAVAMAMLSAVTGIIVSNVAFTGGFDGSNVLPVGGIPQKVQAAMSAGIKTVYIPESCRDDINSDFFDSIEIRYVQKIDEITKELFKNVDLCSQKEEIQNNSSALHIVR